MAPSLRSSSSSTSAAAAAAAAESSATARATTMAPAATSSNASRSSSAASTTTTTTSSSDSCKQPAIGIGSYVKTRQKNFTRYGQVAGGVTDEDGRHLPNLWQVNLFPQQSSSIVVPTKDLTHVEHVLNIPDAFVVPCRGVGTTTTTATTSTSTTTTTTTTTTNNSNANHRRRSRSGTTVNDAKSSLGTDDDDNNDDQVDRLPKIFVDGYDASSASVTETVKAGMRFCSESIQSTLRFSIGSGSGSAAAAAATKNKKQPTTPVDSHKKEAETETETQERPMKMARFIRDTECSLCCEEMMSPPDDSDNTDNDNNHDASILATFPCGHALHVRCFMLWHDQNNSETKKKEKKRKEDRYHQHHKISKSVSCPTCLRDYSLGPDDGPFGR